MFPYGVRTFLSFARAIRRSACRKSTFLNLAIQRGVVEDMGELHSGEFEELANAAKQIFL